MGNVLAFGLVFFTKAPRRPQMLLSPPSLPTVGPQGSMAAMEDASYPERLAPGLLVPHYLVHCWLYYEAGHPLITDAQFDRLAKRLATEWDDAKGHPHAGTIDRGALRTGAGAHQIKIPRRTIQAARLLLEEAMRADWGPEPAWEATDWTAIEEAASLTVSRAVAVAGWRKQDCCP